MAKMLRKAQRRLEARLQGHEHLMKNRSDSKVEMRKSSGGYRKPGSMKGRR
jgi:hypothetical protein